MMLSIMAYGPGASRRKVHDAGWNLHSAREVLGETHMENGSVRILGWLSISNLFIDSATSASVSALKGAWSCSDLCSRVATI